MSTPTLPIRPTTPPPATARSSSVSPPEARTGRVPPREATRGTPTEATRVPGTASPGRDRALDLLRIGCLAVVVLLHSFMSGAVYDATGAVVPTVALSTTVGFAAASWFFQIMPLFFFIGGFAALSQWRRMQSSGGTWTDFLRTRIRRLAFPVLVFIGIAGLLLAVAEAAGLPADLVAAGSLRLGQPLWFLAVYIGLTSLVPVLARAHDRAPRRTLALLATGVVLVDVLARATGIAGLGYLNFLFVWPLVQQCGFVYRDLRARPVRLEATCALGLSALVLLAVLVACGFYSPNMLVNLNPPTGALVLLGLVQFSVLRLVHDRLDRALAGPGIRLPGGRRLSWDRVISWGNTYGMHVYLWHMSVVVTLIAVLGLGGFWLPGIASAGWWATRIPWLLTVLVLASGVAMLAYRVRTPSAESFARAYAATIRALPWVERVLGPRSRGVASVVLGILGVAIALLAGLAPLVWTVAAVACLAASLVLSSGPGIEGTNSQGNGTCAARM